MIYRQGQSVSQHGKPYRLALASALVLYRRVPYIFFFALCLYGIGWLVPRLYYWSMPGSWWIDLTEAPAAVTQTTSLGKDVTFKFCRRLHNGPITVSHVRSFARVANSKQTPAGSYSFDRKYATPYACQYPVIEAKNLPTQSGVYTVRTDLDFSVHGYEKHVSYDFPLTLTDTARSLQDQIEDLQNQIKQLQSQIPQRTSGAQAVQPQPTPPPASTLSPVQATVASTPITVTTRPTTPPSSSPPNPPEETGPPPAPPEAGNSPHGALPTVLTIVQDALGSLQNVI